MVRITKKNEQDMQSVEDLKALASLQKPQQNVQLEALTD